MRSELAALGLTIGLGAGVAYAVDEVNDLNREANMVQACIDAAPDSVAARSDFCTSAPHTAEEVSTLRNTANTTGNLGWLAFIATLCAGGETYKQMRKPDDPVEAK